jgi:hypothetical protein
MRQSKGVPEFNTLILKMNEFAGTGLRNCGFRFCRKGGALIFIAYGGLEVNALKFSYNYELRACSELRIFRNPRVLMRVTVYSPAPL